MERITTWGWVGKWGGQSALIAPTHKALAEVMAALDQQCQKMNLCSVRRTRPEGSDQERNELFSALGINENLEENFSFVPADGDSRLRAEEVVTRAQRFAPTPRLTGPPETFSLWPTSPILISMHQEHTDIVLLSVQQPQFTERRIENSRMYLSFGPTV